MSYLRSTKETHRLMQVARGESAADLALINASLVNVYTGEILKNHAVCTWDKWIAYVGNDPEGCIGKQTQEIDVEGKLLIPGFIDAHTHLAWLSTPHEFLKYAMPGGTTTIITETLEPYPVTGLAGVIDFLQSLKDQPVKLFATAPPMVSTSASASGIEASDLEYLLRRDEIVGLGEIYWQAIKQQPDLYLPILYNAMNSGKVLEGHTAGASEKKLMGYLAAGISSCHEPIRAEEVLDRLRLGLHVMIREGSIRRDLEEIAKIKDQGADLRRLILVSDGLSPGDLLGKGYMEYIVQKAIDCGFDPVTAIQMATLNPAEHFRIDHLVGGVAPGRFADMVAIPDIGNIHAEYVISNGKLIAKDGHLLEAPRAHRFSQDSLNSIHLLRKIKPEDFIVSAPDSSNSLRIRVIDTVTDLVTKEQIIDVPVEDDEIKIDVMDDLLKISALDRTLSPGKMFTGFIRGFRMTAGAIACSAAWDTTNIIVVGADEADMALAVNRISDLQGGAVLCLENKIIEELPLPIFGIMSGLPLKEIDQKLTAVTEAAANLGVPFHDPVLTLITLTGAAIPFLRICEEGLVNLRDGKTLGLFKDEATDVDR